MNDEYKRLECKETELISRYNDLPDDTSQAEADRLLDAIVVLQVALHAEMRKDQTP